MELASWEGGQRKIDLIVYEREKKVEKSASISVMDDMRNGRRRKKKFCLEGKKLGTGV